MKDSERIKIMSPFSYKDREFNRLMVENGIKNEKEEAAKKASSHPSNYDFSSEILNEFRSKWGVLKK